MNYYNEHPCYLEAAKSGESSMFYWWPRIKAVCDRERYPYPKTTPIKPGDIDWYKLVDGQLDDTYPFEVLCNAINIAAVSELGGYPVFLRTDYLSGKHNWLNTCYIPSSQVIPKHVFTLVEESFLADIMGVPINGFAVREFLELDSAFTAFRGLPIAKEYRLFVCDGRVEHKQFYWPENAIAQAEKFESTRPSREDWRRRLEDISVLIGGDMETMIERAEQIGKALGGYWSIDFAHGKPSVGNEGEWYFIDAARGEMSYDTRREGHE